MGVVWPNGYGGPCDTNYDALEIVRMDMLAPTCTNYTDGLMHTNFANEELKTCFMFVVKGVHDLDYHNSDHSLESGPSEYSLSKSNGALANPTRAARQDKDETTRFEVSKSCMPGQYKFVQPVPLGQVLGGRQFLKYITLTMNSA